MAIPIVAILLIAEVSRTNSLDLFADSEDNGIARFLVGDDGSGDKLKALKNAKIALILSFIDNIMSLFGLVIDYQSFSVIQLGISLFASIFQVIAMLNLPKVEVRKRIVNEWLGLSVALLILTYVVAGFFAM